MDSEPVSTLDQADKETKTIWDNDTEVKSLGATWAETDRMLDDEKKKEAPKKSPAPKRAPRKAQLESRLEQFYMGIGIFLLPLSPKDAALFVSFDPTNANDPVRPTFHAQQCASSMAGLAEQSPAVRNILEKMMTGGAVGAVLTTHISLAMAIMANHDINPLELLAGASVKPSTPKPPAPDRMAGNGTPASGDEKKPPQQEPISFTPLGDFAGNRGSNLG